MHSKSRYESAGVLMEERPLRSADREDSCQKRAPAKCATRSSTRPQYALATGAAAAPRLQVLHSVYGPGTRRVLNEAGLSRGMRVADLGCGTGMVSSLLAEMVGPEGEVIGVDFSAEQIAQARQCAGWWTNMFFVQASAADTRLPRESFDLVYSRFLLIHLPDPKRALAEMFALLKPGGILVCEDGDLTNAGSEPQSALQAFSDLWGRLGAQRGVDYTLGRRVYQLVLEAGFTSLQIEFNQPAVAHGENKRLLELSVAEAGPAFVEAGLITTEELNHTLAEMRRANADPAVLAVMPRMAQVWARRPGAIPQGAV